MALALITLVSCQTTEPHNSRACYQAGEFGNFGCVDFGGLVVDSSGRPLARVSVSRGFGADGDQFNNMGYTTEADGRFRLRLIRMLPAPSESASLFVRAAVIPTLPQLVATIRDSALVRVKVIGIGEVPDTVFVNLVLPAP